MQYANGTNTAAHTEDLLTKCRDALTSQREYMAALHAEWYLQTLYCEGQTAVNYDLNTGRDVLYGSGSPYVSPGYNLLDSTVNHMISSLMSSSPKREVRSIQSTEMAIEEARLGKIVLDWAYEYHKVEEKERIAADDFVKMGNTVIAFRFDPTKGQVIGTDEFGAEIHSGELCLFADSPMRWFFDPRASIFDEVRYAIRRTVQPVEWVEEQFPRMRGKLDGMHTSLGEDDLYELRMLNLTQSRRGSVPSMPRDKKLVTLFELFELPCPDYPNGIHAVFVGTGSSPMKLVHDYGQNTYGCIPAVLIAQSRVSGRLFGKSSIKFLIHANQEINNIRRQIAKVAALNGNPILAYPIAGGTPPGTVTNKIGQLLPVDPTSGMMPAYLNPPQMPQWVIESEVGALNLMAMMAPVSSFDRQQAEKATSGIQFSLMDEVRRRALLPMMRSWELGWDAVWKLYLKLFRRFTIFPQQIEALGPEATSISELVSGDMISDNIVVRVVPASAMPSSRSAAFAEWSELHAKIPTLAMDPIAMKRFWEDIGKGDMARTYRDYTDDMELGTRNLLRVIRGEMVLPRMQDDPDVTIDKIVHFMRSTDYEQRLLKDPSLEKRCTDTLTIFGLAKQERDMQQIKAAAAQQAMAANIGAMLGPQDPQQQGKPPKSNAQGGTGPGASQGFSKAANTYRDQGGPGER